jgi:hypothetical protein
MSCLATSTRGKEERNIGKTGTHERAIDLNELKHKIDDSIALESLPTKRNDAKSSANSFRAHTHAQTKYASSRTSMSWTQLSWLMTRRVPISFSRRDFFLGV